MLAVESEKPMIIDINKIQIGDGVTVCSFSDRRAATVISKTAKTFTLQEDTQTLLNGPASGEPDALKITVGGFAGNTQGTQRYNYATNPNGIMHTVRWSVRHAGWRTDNMAVIEGRHGFYDFNF